MHSKPGEWYPENILSWYKHKDNKTVKFVYFEDLKKVSEQYVLHPRIINFDTKRVI